MPPPVLGRGRHGHLVAMLGNPSTCTNRNYGFAPGADADVAAKAPDGTLTLGIDGNTLALGPELAGRLYVSAL